MFPYFLLIGIPFVLNIILPNSKDNRKNRQTVTIFFILYFLLLALRSEEIGVDLANYKSIYIGYGKRPWKALVDNIDSELGYAIFCKLIYLTKADYHMFLIIVAVIEIVPLAILYRQEIEDAGLSIVLFLNIGIFSMLFSGLRQSIAVALGAIAYLLLKNKKNILFVLIVLLAMSFHVSAAILFFMLPLRYMRITKKWMFFVVPTIVLILIFNVPIFTALATFLPERYTNYNIVTKTGAWKMLAMYCIIAIYVFVISGEVSEGTLILRNFLLFSIVLQIFVPINGIAMRVNYYYIIFIPLLVPKVIRESSLKFIEINRLAKLVMILFFVSAFFYEMYYGADILRVFPYKFFWE